MDAVRSERALAQPGVASQQHPNSDGEGQPSEDHDACGDLTHRAARSGLGGGAVIVHHLGRDHADRQPKAERNQDQVVEIAQDRDEVGDEVDRRQGVGCDGQTQKLGGDWRAGITSRQPDGVGVPPQRERPAPERLYQRAARSFSTRSVFSQEKPPSLSGVRPKWP